LRGRNTKPKRERAWSSAGSKKRFRTWGARLLVLFAGCRGGEGRKENGAKRFVVQEVKREVEVKVKKSEEV